MPTANLIEIPHCFSVCLKYQINKYSKILFANSSSTGYLKELSWAFRESHYVKKWQGICLKLTNFPGLAPNFGPKFTKDA